MSSCKRSSTGAEIVLGTRSLTIWQRQYLSTVVEGMAGAGGRGRDREVGSGLRRGEARATLGQHQSRAVFLLFHEASWGGYVATIKGWGGARRKARCRFPV